MNLLIVNKSINSQLKTAIVKKKTVNRHRIKTKIKRERKWSTKTLIVNLIGKFSTKTVNC